MNNAPKHSGTRVCVTGASGYIGSHLVRELLSRGYHVHATVRDPNNAEKTKHLHQIAEENKAGQLTLFAADLMKAGDFDAPIADCTYVCHVASAVYMHAKDPQREIVDPALQGTQNVLDAIRKAKSVKRLVLTSSVAAIYDDQKPHSHIYTEADWNESADLKSQPYQLSKVLAERAAWDFQAALPPDERFDLIAIHPGMVFGPVYAPVHLRTSPSILGNLLNRDFPACPRLHFGIVDVRDVADAHANALESDTAQGRYLCVHEGLWLEEIAAILRPHFPRYPIPKGRLPNWLMYLGSLFDKRISFSYLRRNLNRQHRSDHTKITRDLNLQFRPTQDTLVDTCEALIAHQLVKTPKA